jgi:type IV pilus assembly protein PilV
MNISKQNGFSLIEILITIVILMVGLLGLAGLQGFALTSQLESYQRAQALILLKDMEGRINANRNNAASYITTSYITGSIGTGAACPAEGASVASKDLSQWCNALMGVAETQSGAASVGTMVGARGCITQAALPASGVATQYVIAVAWQGMNKTAAPSITCGAGDYGSNEALRRVVAVPVNFADLYNLL